MEQELLKDPVLDDTGFYISMPTLRQVNEEDRVRIMRNTRCPISIISITLSNSIQIVDFAYP